MLQFNSVQKHYGSFLALDIPSLLLDKGVYWLQGENGSGKTTLLKMIAGLHPFKGDIILQSSSIKKSRQAFICSVNYAEAEPLYPPFLTAKDLVQLYITTKKGDGTRVWSLIEQLHIADAYTQPLATYSSGMIKKLSLVLAFIGNPQLILLDEPLITIDADAVHVICNLIKKWHDEKGVSFIITSHQSFHTGQVAFTNRLQAANQTISIAANE